MLALSIRKKLFDMILSGEKKEEYREIKPYYTKRFQTKNWLDKDGAPTGTVQKILLRNGYSGNARMALLDCKLYIRAGRPEWGAEPDKKYYVLEIVNINLHN